MADEGFRARKCVPDWMQWLIRFEYLGMIIVVIYLILTKQSDAMFISGMLSAILVLYAFEILMRLTPETYDILWKRNIIKQKISDQNQRDNIESKNVTHLKEEYKTFLQDLEKSMNHEIFQWVIAIIFSLLGLALLVYQGGARWLTYQSIAWRMRLIFQPLIGLFIGLMAWRMSMVGWYIIKLGREFNLDVQWGHPDDCGGLEPIGNICLWNAFIVTIPAVYLSLWIILPSYLGFENFRYWKPMLVYYLQFPIIFALLSFFAPLLSIHQIMLEKRIEFQQQLAQLALSIDSLENELLDTSNRLTLDQREEKSKLIKFLRELYVQKEKIPVWPINNAILKKFVISQVLPVLGLFDVPEKIKDLIESLVNFLS